MNEKRRTVLLGVALVGFLALSYTVNVFFFGALEQIFSSVLFAVAMLFIHNVLAISLILLGMTFYVSLILAFFPKRKYEYVVLEHPRTFALVFTIMILMVSIFRTSTLVHGGVQISMLGWILLMSSPNGIIEGYGIFLTIKKTLKRNMKMKDLASIYSLFFAAAVIEACFVQVLRSVPPK